MSTMTGRWNTDGTLSIIDRAKNLVKQPSGEYVAVEKLEAEYNSDKNVKSVCVIADGDHDTVVAVVVPADKVCSSSSCVAKQNFLNFLSLVAEGNKRNNPEISSGTC